MMKILLVLFLLLPCSLFFCRYQCQAAGPVGEVSLEVKEEPMHKVVQDIGRQLGYHVVIMDNWQKMPVSGKFTKVSVEEFFRRVLKGHNIFLTVDEKRRVIVVQAAGSRTLKANSSSQSRELSPDGVEVRSRFCRMNVVDGPSFGPDIDPMDLEGEFGARTWSTALLLDQILIPWI